MADVLAAARTALDAQAETLARLMKESPEAILRATEAAAPAALASLIGRGETDDGVEEVRVALNDAQTGPELLTTLGARLDGVRLRGRAGGAGVRLLGGRGQALVEQLGAYAGLKPSSASTLVDLVVPVVLASLRTRGAPPADPEEIRELLRRQAEPVNRELPAEFKPRFGIVLQPEPAAASTAATALPPWIWAALVIAVLLVAALAWWLTAGHARAETAAGTAPLQLWHASLQAQAAVAFTFEGALS